MTQSEVYDGVLTRLFSSGSTAKILDFFLDHKEYDYSITEISEKTDLSFRTIVKELPKLEALGLIINHRKVGRAVLYKLDDRNEIVSLMERFTLLISQKDALHEPHRVEQEILEPNDELESQEIAEQHTIDA